ncbi:Mor transcription activator family protein [Zoogloea sp.]|uniref:Mor transcription activator family protein n=1 Tax=Zoogloea sp. TaxID=49181 RepID=UPI001AD0B9A9|nr:Mor transcription activator family protein [Zoogloea sp.]MBN8283417.1 hypothetical protein [Zoogloea sp.]
MNLPPVIRDLAALIGIENVMVLLDHHMLGCDWRISKTRDSEWYREWSDVLGEGPTDVVMRAWGGEVVYFANCAKVIQQERDRAMVAQYDALIADGLSTRAARRTLCRKFRLSDKRVRLIVNGAPPPVTQGPSILTNEQLDMFGF